MKKVLSGIGANVEIFFPNRFSDGYGVSREALERCYNLYKPELLLTVDCGTNSHDLLESFLHMAKVIVTDHHEINDKDSFTYPVINPCRINGMTPFAGVGVAFKLCHALYKKFRKNVRMLPDLRQFFDYIALGTVADVVPLVGENRTMVKYGMKLFNENPSLWVQTIKKIAGLNKKIGTYELAFVFAPRLNASGRMKDAETAYNLLMTNNEDEADALAVELEHVNNDRKRNENKILALTEKEICENMDITKDFGLVAAGHGWHKGIIGIVASRMCEKYNRPVAVISIQDDGTGRGSCRAIEGGDITAVLNKCADFLDSFGGHRMAAGFNLKKGCLSNFREAFNSAVKKEFGNAVVQKTFKVDAWLSKLEDVNEKLFEEIKLMEPFGVGNPSVLFGMKNLEIAEAPVEIGKNKEHLRFKISDGKNEKSAVSFRYLDKKLPPPSGKIDILFRITENNYMGHKTIEMHVERWRRSS